MEITGVVHPMKIRYAAILLGFAASVFSATPGDAPLVRPKAGKVKS